MSQDLLNRQIRVFISSTFQDLQIEREYLIKKVLPQLQVEAAKRYVSIIPLDLRWGITEEEAKSGKVLEICLKEIDKSYPYFIGLIGNRYGWTPPVEEFDQNPILREDYSWLRSDLEEGMSVTEIEMQYAVLRRNVNDDDVIGYFYFRKENNDSIVIDTKLAELKKKITTAHSNVKTERFYNVEHLGKLVKQDMLQLLDKLYPESEISDTIRKRYTNKFYLERLCQDYFPVKKYQNVLDSFVKSSDFILVVSGKSGSGKSTLLANWLNTNVFENRFAANVFVDSGIADNDFEKAIGFLYSELNYNIFGIDCDLFEKSDTPIPSELGRLAYVQANFNLQSSIEKLAWLPWVLGENVSEKILLFIDGIDHISNTIPINTLFELKNRYQIVITASEDSDLLCQLMKYDRNLRVYSLDEVTDELKSNIIDSVLERYGKKLSDLQKARVLSCSLMNNLVILHSFLDEIIEYGIYENIDIFISGYLAAYDELDFYNRVISRYETDYSFDLVSQALSLIYYSGRGISEYDILSVIGVKTYQWSQFYTAFYRHLTIIDGLLRIQNKWIRQIISDRYGHLEDTSRRKIIAHSSWDQQRFEVPYQYYHLNETEMLYKTLCDLSYCFDDWYNYNKELLRDYWLSLKQSGGYSLHDYLLQISAKSELDYHGFEKFAEFASMFDDEISTSICMYEQAIKRLDVNQTTEAARLMNKIGCRFIQKQEYIKALSTLYDSLRKYQVVYEEDVQEMADLYSNISYVYICLEMLDEALEFIERALKAYKSGWYREDSHWISYYEQMDTIQLRLEHFHIAEDDQRTALSWSEIFYGEKHPITNRIAVRRLYAAIKEHAYSIDMELVYKFYRALDLYIDSWGKDSTDNALGYEYLSDVLLMQDKYSDALRIAEKAKSIRERQLGTSHTDTRMVYRLISRIYAKQNNFNEAFDWIDKSTPSKEELGGGGSKALELKSQIYLLMDDRGKAIECLDKAITLWRHIYKDDNNPSLNDKETIAKIYISIDQNNNAIECYDYIIKHCCDYPKKIYCHEQVGDVYLKNYDLINAYLRYKTARELLLLHQELSYGKNHCLEIDQKISKIKELVTQKGLFYRIIFKLFLGKELG